MRRSAGPRAFWAIAEHFRKLVEWEPSSASYSRRRPLRVDGTQWSATAYIHVVPRSRRGSPSYEFKSSIALWPRNVDDEAEKRVASLGWYRSTKAALVRAGYRGKWE